MQIKYGIVGNNIDITEICFNILLNNNVITIPAGDHCRTSIFTDPVDGTLKKIFIIDEDNQTTEYDDLQIISINLIDKTITTKNSKQIRENAIRKLNDLHSNLHIKYGTFADEYPEQVMATTFLTGNEKVLEIGGNVGRNSLIIGSIVQNNNFVTLECDLGTANLLCENREINNLSFHVEKSALSKRKLIQRNWATTVSDDLPSGYSPVHNITVEELNNKYNIAFDTLIFDCEGAFYYILMDMPEILNNIKLIIMENDYHNIEHKKYVDTVLKQNKFFPIYVESGGWGPCYNVFFQTWKKY